MSFLVDREFPRSVKSPRRERPPPSVAYLVSFMYWRVGAAGVGVREWASRKEDPRPRTFGTTGFGATDDVMPVCRRTPWSRRSGDGFEFCIVPTEI